MSNVNQASQYCHLSYVNVHMSLISTSSRNRADASSRRNSIVCGLEADAINVLHAFRTSGMENKSPAPEQEGHPSIPRPFGHQGDLLGL